jgi:hypothetical protein
MTSLILLIPSLLESKVHVRIVENMVITSEIVLEQVVTLQHLRVRPLLSRKLDIEIVVPKKSRMKRYTASTSWRSRRIWWWWGNAWWLQVGTGEVSLDRGSCDGPSYPPRWYSLLYLTPIQADLKYNSSKKHFLTGNSIIKITFFTCLYFLLHPCVPKC